MSVRSHEFGRELRRRRLAAGLSLAALSMSVHYSKAQLSKVERGLKEPSRELAALCDTRLGAGGALVALVRGRNPEPAVQTGTENDGGSEDVWLMHLSVDGASWFQPVGRRQVLLGGAASLVGISTGGEDGAAAAPETDLLEGFQLLFSQYRRIGQTVSPGTLLPVLIAQTHVLRGLAGAASGEHRRGILRLASRYAEYIGWLTQESGDDEAAMWWTRQAVELSAAGGDRNLAAYAFVRHALIALYQQDGDRTVALALRGQDTALPPRIRALALQREAQGHAINGDHATSMRCLDAARDLFARSEPVPGEPLLGTTNLADPAAMVKGWCLFDLGRPKEAADVLSAELEKVPEHALRMRTRFGVRQARALAAAGDIDHASQLLGELLGSVDVVDSATVRTDLVLLAKTLNRYHRSPSVREIVPELGRALSNAY